MIVRYTKITIVGSLALFAFLVVFNNLTDFAANRPFVSHVLNMDTTFRDPAVAWRAIDTSWMWLVGYSLIIVGEILAFALIAIAMYRLFRARHGSAAEFNQAKAYVHLAVLATFLVWFVGLMVVGGEWFLMWQSSTWNGQEPAFRFYITALLVLIYVSQPDVEQGD